MGAPLHRRTEKVARKLCAALGKVFEVGLYEDVTIGNVFMKGLIEFELKNCLRKGMNMGNPNDRIHWLDLQYEKIAKYCAKCGYFGHDDDVYEIEKMALKIGEVFISKDLGSWLKVRQKGKMVAWFEKRNTQVEGNEDMGRTRPKLFLDNMAKERFESDFRSRGIYAPPEVNFEFFAKEPELSVFQLFTQMGWKPFLAIKEKIYPSLIREFYSNLVFSEEEGEPVGRSMLRGKRADLTTGNIRRWIGVKKGDFKRYSSREPITMETYSIEKAAKKLGGSPNGEVTLAQLGVNERLLAHVLCQLIMPKAGTSNDPSQFDIFLMWCAVKGWKPDLAFIILNHMKDTLARPTTDLPYETLITLIARARGVVFEDDDWVGANVQGNYDQRLIQNLSFKKVGGKWIKLGKAKVKPGEGTEKRKMNVKHGRRPPKSTKGSSTRKSSRLLKKDISSPSSPIQVLAGEKEESADFDATLYFESLVHQPIKEEPTEKEYDTTMFSSASNKAPNQEEHQAVSSQLAPEDESTPENEPEHDHPVAQHSPKTKPASSEPLPQPPLTPLAEIREQLKLLTSQLASAREEIYELKMINVEMRAQQKEASMTKPTPLDITPDHPSNA
ncbi:Retrovirus-related Pol polyprotein from transposon RE1 [Senna tora]|uniref:Retrovirus-related Pol polyprotein from transposon RE1 n=1 Tax=Senna tora TaxID=362788 RepID=A0A834SG13_9FABA|nr:Retrovirus-related Pol polyprotein from transposon RE1 [Senna tora]